MTQPTISELKEKIIYLRYLVSDSLPKKGFKRMRFYTELHDRPGEIYFGLSFREKINNTTIKKMVENGQIIELSIPEIMPFEKDVWLNEKGEVFLLSGYEPWKELNTPPFASPREFNPAVLELSTLIVNSSPYYKLENSYV